MSDPTCAAVEIEATRPHLRSRRSRGDESLSEADLAHVADDRPRPEQEAVFGDTGRRASAGFSSIGSASVQG